MYARDGARVSASYVRTRQRTSQHFIGAVIVAARLAGCGSEGNLNFKHSVLLPTPAPRSSSRRRRPSVALLPGVLVPGEEDVEEEDLDGDDDGEERAADDVEAWAAKG
jgi:hypothetical protein